MESHAAQGNLVGDEVISGTGFGTCFDENMRCSSRPCWSMKLFLHGMQRKSVPCLLRLCLFRILMFGKVLSHLSHRCSMVEEDEVEVDEANGSSESSGVSSRGFDACLDESLRCWYRPCWLTKYLSHSSQWKSVLPCLTNRCFERDS